MPSDTKRDILKSVRSRSFLNRDFDSFRADLLTHARSFYRENINDFSESSLGGVLLDLPAYVGDVMSFYLDHSFSELDPMTAVESANIERHLRNSGVPITGAAPAIVLQNFFVEIPARLNNGVAEPATECLPVIEEQTIISADNGTDFNLLESVDFTKRKSDGTLVADYTIGTTSGATPTSFVLKASGFCVSGFYTQETFSIGDFQAFRQLTLSNPDVSEITSVTDSLGNSYYEVGSLAQDVVYRAIPNGRNDINEVPEVLQIVPAPYRFTSKVNLGTRASTLTFGGGSADTLEDDVIPDPSTFALPLYGKKMFARLSINPQQLLTTKTLGVISANTTLTIAYRYGGGLSHNAEPNTLQSIKTLRMSFPGNPQGLLAGRIRSSVETTNLKKAAGGDDAPSVDDLKGQIAPLRNAQERIVSKADLLARTYTMPSNFGRVFRAAIRSNPNNPLASQLFVISRDSNSNLTLAPDTLKLNLAKYLNGYRMISDAIDILDASVINLGLAFEIIADPTANKKLILQGIIGKLKRYFDVKNFQIDQPIVLNDVQNIIYNTQGVVSINAITFSNITGIVSNRQYSDVYIDVITRTTKGLLVPTAGGIFELRFPDINILGRAV